MSELPVLGPASEKQKLFLTCDADIVVYGGEHNRLH